MPATAKFMTCPLCARQSLRPHCESGKCEWYKCTDDTCDAFISPTQRIAHRLDPNRTVDSTKSQPRLRYEMSETGWRERIGG